jgi:CheY-like chemotaxis protein
VSNTTPELREALRILIVDDDAQVRFITSRLFRARGHIVEERADALGTVAHLARFGADVVLLDVTMPGLSGDSLAGVLKRQANGEMVVLFSAIERSELERLARECGAAGFLCKQDPEDLVLRLEEVVRQARRRG